jgi:hypothetical protein
MGRAYSAHAKHEKYMRNTCQKIWREDRPLGCRIRGWEDNVSVGYTNIRYICMWIGLMWLTMEAVGGLL